MIGLRTETNSPSFNLALEETLLDQLPHDSEGFFFLWRNSPSVIIGRHQNTLEEVNGQYLREHSIPVIRRETGGGAVYHDLGNLNFSFIVNIDGKSDTSFGLLLRPIADALKELGINADISGRNDLLVNGRKFSGSAQRKTEGKLLQHGTLMIAVDTEHISDILTGDPEKYRSKGIASHRSRIVNLADCMDPNAFSEAAATDFTLMTGQRLSRIIDLSSPDNRETAIALVQNALMRRLVVSEVPIARSIMEQAEELEKSKYSSWEWNWGRAPALSESFGKRFPWGKVECRLKVVKGHVKEFRIFGDFFSYGDISELEKEWIGLRHERRVFAAKAAAIRPERWFVGAADGEATAFFTENIPESD